jgi:hypothetical protein
MFTVILTIILIMPADQKDIQQAREMTSLDECWSAARAWTDQDAKAAGVAGFAAACASTPTPGRDG